MAEAKVSLSLDDSCLRVFHFLLCVFYLLLIDSLRTSFLQLSLCICVLLLEALFFEQEILILFHHFSSLVVLIVSIFLQCEITVRNQELFKLHLHGLLHAECIEVILILVERLELRGHFFLDDAFDLGKPHVFLGNLSESLLALLLEVGRASRLLYQAENLFWFHMDDFRHATLHDQKVRVVHIQLYATEQVAHNFLRHFLAVNEELGGALRLDDLRDRDGFLVLVARRSVFALRVIENKRD